MVVAYHRLQIPLRGDTIHFQPLEHVTSITFTRGKAFPSLGNGVVESEAALKTNVEVAEVVIISLT